MKILKIKKWLHLKTPQFEVMHKTTDSRILAVRRIKDRRVFDLSYRHPDAFDENAYFIIREFCSNLIHIAYERKGCVGVKEIDDIVMQGGEFSHFES